MLKKSLLDSLYFFENHVVAISIIILPIVVPVEVLTSIYYYFLASEEVAFAGKFVPVIFGFIVYPIYAAGVVFYIASVIAGEKIDTKILWRLGAKFWFPYIAMSIFVSVIVVLGVALLIIPGVVFAIRYTFAEFELLLNQNKPLDAMKSSWNLTKDYMWVILGGYILITLVLYTPYYIISLFFDEASISYWVLDTLSNIVYSVLGVLYTIFSFRIYEIANLKNNQLLNSDEP